MQKFTIDKRYNFIAISQTVEARVFDEIIEWCYNKEEQFDVFKLGIVYKHERDLTEFLLRWQ